MNPTYDLGLVARVPAGNAWDDEFTLYLPTAKTTAAANSAYLALDDVVRFRLYDADGTAALITATDQAASAGGTTVTIDDRGTASTTPAAVTVALSGTDTDQTPGVYRFILDVSDTSDSGRYHVACIGRYEILPGPA